MSKLEKLLEKLQEDPEFTKDYEVTKDNMFEDTTFIRVNRHKKTYEEQTTYNPSISGMDYKRTFCFRIDIIKHFVLDTVHILPVTYNPESKYNIGLGIGEPAYTQTISFFDIDVTAIKKYIINTELILINKQTHDNTYCASNEYLCPNCKCKIKLTP